MARQIISKHRWPWYSKITSKVYLGAIPCKNYSHDKTFREKENIKAILSILEKKETYKHTFLSNPFSLSFWKKNRFDHLHISSQDLKPVSPKNRNLAADFIHKHAKRNKKIYVHCKSGRSRSAICIISYLRKYKNMSPIRAINFVKKKRKIVYLNHSQLRSLYS